MLVGALASSVLAGAAAIGLSATGPAAPRPALRLLGPLNPATRLNAELLLSLPGQPGLDRAVAAIERHGSSRFAAFLTPAQLGRRYGLPLRRLRALVRVLRARGITTGRLDAERSTLAVTAPAAALESLLGVRIAVAVTATGRRVRLVAGRPRPPAGVTAVISGLLGVDDRPLWHAADVPATGLDPGAAAIAYDIAPLHRLGIEGQGQTVAVISFADVSRSDLAGYDARHGLPPTSLRIDRVDGGSYDIAAEAALDVEIVHAIAPAARIELYEAPLTQGGAYADMIRAVAGDRRVAVVASSWGSCELTLPDSERRGDAVALRAAAAAGQSVFIASGDQGAYDCQGADPADHRISVDWPASSQDAIAVGGTRLSLTPGFGYAGETGWEDQLTVWGGGGGVSRFDPRPAWQAGPGVLGPFSDGRRQVPDVAADADQGTGWAVVADGTPKVLGGTSAAAPFWAAAMLLVRQYAQRAGVPALGDVDPLLYALAAGHPRYPPFHDVTRGGNRYYQAAPGWDPATGLGSPDVYNLARDLVAYLRAHRAH